MKVLGNITDIWLRLAIETGKHYVYLSWLDIVTACDLYNISGQEYLEALYSAAPVLRPHLDDIDDDTQMIVDEWTLVECDSREEAREVYLSIKGDDGPTKTNDYNGPMSVYALTIHPDGLGYENT